jgi:oxalate decarboxylase/phosphoglucose isomerase-like protein (cupin superfamily)
MKPGVKRPEGGKEYFTPEQCYIQVADLAPQDVGPGEVVLIPPSARQRIANTGKEDLVFLAICTPRFRQEAYEDLQ